MTIKKLPNDIASLLFDRLNDEYTAHYFYTNCKNYCENIGFTNAAEYFKKEAEDELVHAAGLQSYLTDWNVLPILKPLKTPEVVSGLVDILQKAYEIEYELYEAYEEISSTIFKKGDLCTFDFLSKYRNIQQSSVAEYATLLNKVALIDSNDKNFVFILENEIFG